MFRIELPPAKQTVNLQQQHLTQLGYRTSASALLHKTQQALAQQAQLMKQATLEPKMEPKIKNVAKGNLAASSVANDGLDAERESIAYFHRNRNAGNASPFVGESSSFTFNPISEGRRLIQQSMFGFEPHKPPLFPRSFVPPSNPFRPKASRHSDESDDGAFGQSCAQGIFLAAADDVTRQHCIYLLQAASKGGFSSSPQNIASAAALNRNLVSMQSLSAVNAVLMALGKATVTGLDHLSLKAAGFDIHTLRAFGCDWMDIKTVGFTAADVKTAGYDLKCAHSAGFDVLSLITAFNLNDVAALCDVRCFRMFQGRENDISSCVHVSCAFKLLYFHTRFS